MVQWHLLSRIAFLLSLYVDVNRLIYFCYENNKLLLRFIWCWYGLVTGKEQLQTSQLVEEKLHKLITNDSYIDLINVLFNFMRILITFLFIYNRMYYIELNLTVLLSPSNLNDVFVFSLKKIQKLILFFLLYMEASKPKWINSNYI